jgi:hypothetical protein
MLQPSQESLGAPHSSDESSNESFCSACSDGSDADGSAGGLSEEHESASASSGSDTDDLHVRGQPRLSELRERGECVEESDDGESSRSENAGSSDSASPELEADALLRSSGVLPAVQVEAEQPADPPAPSQSTSAGTVQDFIGGLARQLEAARALRRNLPRDDLFRSLQAERAARAQAAIGSQAAV